MKRMIFTLLLLLVTATGSGRAFAQGDDSTVYVIKKGDTLWGLSERFFKDPLYWPNLWANNDPTITNPHLIFPGQRVKVYSDRVVVEPPAPAAGEAAKPEIAPPGAAKGAEEAALPEKVFVVRGGTGFLLEKEPKPSGHIITTNQNRQMVGEDDVVYTDLGRQQGAKAGDRFSIFKNLGTVSHPVTNFIMGYKIIPLGTLQLSEVEEKTSKAIITKSFMEIGPESYLMPYRERRREVPLKASTRETTGYIVDSQTGNKAISSGDVVFLDMGSAQGVEIGNMLYVARDIVPDQQYVHGTVEKLPADVVGALVIVEAGEKISTALIVKSIDTIYIGDRVELKKSK